ncbi:MAG: exosortase/archaeosortase family protein [Acidobacteria bacterium]|nr:exosortase/archaeosortase family protein [Acidobacteriota bacterium]
MEQTPTRSLLRPALVVAAVAFAYWGVVAKLGRVWWEDENYSHGLLIPLIIGYILWTERDALARAVRRPSLAWGVAFVVSALFALWAGTAGAELFVQRTSLVVLCAGLVVYFFGFALLRRAAVPLVLLLLAIPIPAIIFNKIAFPLQLFASRCAVASMQLLDIPVLREGNVIELMPLDSTTTKKLEVVEACSGIRSLMTLVTLAVVFAYFTYPRDGARRGGDTSTGEGDSPRGRFAWLKSYGAWRSILLVAAAVPIAIITNAARVSGTGVLARYYGTRVADGFFHEFSGWVVYVAAFLLLFAFAWLLDRVALRKRRRARREGAKARAAARADREALSKTAARETAPTTPPRGERVPESPGEAEVVAETAQ